MDCTDVLKDYRKVVLGGNRVGVIWSKDEKQGELTEQSSLRIETDYEKWMKERRHEKGR